MDNIFSTKDLTKETINHLYNVQNLTQKEIAEMYGCTNKNISYLLIKHGLNKPKLSEILPENQLNNLYSIEKKSAQEIANLYDCSEPAIRTLLKKYKVRIRSFHEGIKEHHSKNVKVNIDFFRRKSPDLFYLLGIWASDGVVFENRLQLKLNDKDVIDWICSTIEYKNEVKFVKKEIITMEMDISLDLEVMK
ncbi:hypothetical protein C1I58_06300 [Bacillus sp. PIC28]|nr:hypothetical protein C1I58_06300 [Bacillus sp. PIC28]